MVGLAETPQTVPHIQASRLRNAYLLALAVVGTLAIIGQIVVQMALVSQRSSAEVINIAGRQRMLSQKLTKEALLMETSLLDEHRRSARKRLNADLAEWEAAHERLTRGDLADPELALVTSETRRMLDALEPSKQNLAEPLHELAQLETPEPALVRALAQHVLTAEQVYLPKMDALVFAYSRIASQRLTETRRIESARLAFMLIVLFVEGWLIFRPLIQRLRDAMERLDASRSRYARTMVGARDGFWDWKSRTNTLDVSPRFRELVGLTPSETVTWKQVLTRLAASDRPRLAPWVAAGGIDEIDLDLRVETEDGFRWLKLRGSPSGDGYVSGRLSDIDRQRQLEVERERLIATQEARLEDASEDLRQASVMRAVGTLAGGIAHDFNNLLQMIILEAELLEDQHGPSPSLSTIHQASREASTLAKQLMVLSRGQTGVVLEPLDLASTVVNMQPMLARVVSSNVKLSCHFDEALPPIDADAGQLRQILINLCINARDAMPDGGPLRISARPRRGRFNGNDDATDGVELAVEDEGVGMSQAIRQRVFEPFFTTKQLGRGTGLGLAMVHKIVERHRGRIMIETAEGSGTVVRLWFPASTSGRRPLAAPANDSGTLEPLHLLVVEDENAIRASVQRLLESRGHKVWTAIDGPSALDIATSLTRIDALVCDVMLPGMLGPEVADHIRRLRGVHLPTLFITGYAQQPVDVSAPRTRLLLKPFTLSALDHELALLVDDAFTRLTAG